MLEDRDSELKFLCPECGGLNTQSLPLNGPDLGADSVSEMTTYDTVYTACVACNEDLVIEVVATPFGTTAKFMQYPESAIEVKQWGDGGEYDFLDTIFDPDRIFLDTADEMERHLEAYKPDPLSAVSFYHMLFTRLFSAFEAYLADQLISYVLNDKTALVRLLAKAPGLSELKFPLVAVEARAGLVADEVKRYLRSVNYHDLQKAGRLYDIALDQEVFGTAPVASRQILLEAVPARHDCVHRNGRDLDGRLRTEIDSTYVQSVSDAMRVLVSHIHRIITPPPPVDDSDWPF